TFHFSYVMRLERNRRWGETNHEQKIFQIKSSKDNEQILQSNCANNNNKNCALCYVFDNAVKCSNCGKYICDASTPWKNQSDDKIFVIEASCPICSKVMYHDFY
ncbi:MAG: hypothetical protein WA364_17775, partial [Candidatus Nitrosopolaris sp.]